MKPIQIATNLHILPGAVNTGVLVEGDKALLFDCCDTVTPERLQDELGVTVADILCTQHRRANVAGAYRSIAPEPPPEGACSSGVGLSAPAAERDLFDGVEDYWNDPKNRWHLYHHQPGQQVPVRPLWVTSALAGGDSLLWADRRIAAVATPGATDGSMSYGVEIDDQFIGFCGDAIFGPGRVWEIHALQKGNERIGDYHGFIGNLHKLLPSLERLRAFDMLVPSHGDVITEPNAAIDLLIERLDALWSNYASTSCLNHYFPGMMQEYTPPGLTVTEPAFVSETREPPSHVLRPPYTSWLLRSETGAGLLIDCGDASVIEWVRERIADGTISELEGVWITHYHDDHVDALPDLVGEFGCWVGAVDPLTDVIEHPEAWFLPCISPAATPVTARREDGEQWQWHEFALTAYHLPGQTFYHSGLLADGHGEKVCFAGDSGSPTGLDDHCCGNRNWLREGTGFRRVIDIWRKTRPDYIFNDHQPLAYRFTDAELDLMGRTLVERERILAELTPWPHPNFATDEHWVRVYPYEQSVAPGGETTFDVRFTNHADREIVGEIETVAPEGWIDTTGRQQATVAPLTDGAVGDGWERPDGRIGIALSVPPDAAPGKHVVPVRIWWDGRYLGQYRHAIVNVLGQEVGDV